MRRFITLLTLAALLAGCGGDQEAPAEEESAAAATEEDTETAGSPEAGEEAGDIGAFCDTAVEAIAVVGAGPEVDFETASPEEIDEALGAYAEQSAPLLDDLEAAAPEEISADIETIVTLIRGALEGGEPPFEEPEFVEADSALDDYMLGECAYPSLDVAAQEYAFEGVPEVVEAGTYGITFSNQGAEVHEMIMFRLADDAGPLDELLQLPEEESVEQLTFVSAAFAEQEQSDVTFLELTEPGRYALVCFLPQGTTSLDQLEEEPPPDESPAADGSPAADESSEAPPHAFLGMTAEFEVQ